MLNYLKFGHSLFSSLAISHMNMESPDTKSNKSAGQYIPRGVVRSNSPKLPSRNHAVISQKAPQTKESTKPQEMKLHTQQRAVQRALFNYSVATKLFIMDQQKKQVEKLQKMIEKEEVRMLRKQMIPRAQLMPIFDKPFCPQRSSRPLTIPRDPNFRLLNANCSNSISCR